MKKLIVRNTNFLEDYKIPYLPYSDQKIEKILELFKSYTGRENVYNQITNNIFELEFDFWYFFSALVKSNKYLLAYDNLIDGLFEGFDVITIVGYNPPLLVEPIIYYQLHRYNILKRNKYIKFYVNEKLADKKIESKEYSGINHKFKQYIYNKSKIDNFVKNNLVKLVNTKYYFDLNFVEIDKEFLIYLFEDKVKFSIYQSKIMKKNISKIITYSPSKNALMVTSKINFPFGLVDGLVKIEVDFSKFNYNRYLYYGNTNKYEKYLLDILTSKHLNYPLVFNYITSKKFPSYKEENEYLWFKEVIDIEED